MATLMTTQELVQNSILGILGDAATAGNLAVAGRNASVVGNLPDQGFTGRGLPAVVVQRPILEGVEPWGNNEERRRHRVELLVFDGRKVGPDKNPSEERAELLAERCRKALEAVPWLRMAWLHTYFPDCGWEEGDGVQLDSGLIGRSWVMTVTTTGLRGPVSV